MDEPELGPDERARLDEWSALAPPTGFADRVLAARVPTARRRWPLVAGGVIAVAAAMIFVLARPGSRAAVGAIATTERTSVQLGDRGVAVVEPAAALTWSIDGSGGAVIEQSAGDVFYRVDRGDAFVVHTPGGTVRVTGTCFRIEVPMNKKHVVASGAAGAVLATAVVITVYEGAVIAETRNTAPTELVAGQRATLGGDGAVALDKPTLGTALAALGPDDQRASREQLLERTAAQRAEVDKLRKRVSELERRSNGAPSNAADEGRAWYDPSPETLKEWVEKCHVRADTPDLKNWQPLPESAAARFGLEPNEVGPANAAYEEVAKAYRRTVRALYVEATGDSAGAESLSLDAMEGEIEEKGAQEERGVALQKISKERAGMAPPPPDLSKLSPAEQLLRARVALGGQLEAALAKRLGPERAKQLRGDGWGNRSDWSGCPVK